MTQIVTIFQNHLKTLQRLSLAFFKLIGDEYGYVDPQAQTADYAEMYNILVSFQRDISSKVGSIFSSQGELASRQVASKPRVPVTNSEYLTLKYRLSEISLNFISHIL